MSAAWDAIKERSRKLSDSLRKNTAGDIRDIQFGTLATPITMDLDGNLLVYENQTWRLDSVDGTTLTKKTAQLKEQNRMLLEENQMLKFKLDILLDMHQNQNNKETEKSLLPMTSCSHLKKLFAHNKPVIPCNFCEHSIKATRCLQCFKTFCWECYQKHVENQPHHHSWYNEVEKKSFCGACKLLGEAKIESKSASRVKDKKSTRKEWIKPEKKNFYQLKTVEKLCDDIEKIKITTSYPGLNNLGNTCFFNASLQALSALRQTMTKITFPEDANSFAAKFLSCCKTLCSLGSTFSPNFVFNHIAQIYPVYGKYRQQDAHELICRIFEILEKDINLESWKSCVESHIKCVECENIDLVKEPSLCFSLDILNVKAEDGPFGCAEEGFQRILNSFFMEREMQGSKCQKCNGLLKQRYLMNGPPPEILTFHIKRFYMTEKRKGRGMEFTKSPKSVVYPQEISLLGQQYKLRSLVCHRGSSLSSGHYIAYKCFEEQWYKMDDSRCTADQYSSLLLHSASNVYIIFYEIDNK